MGLRARRLGPSTSRISSICLFAAGFLIANSGGAFSQEGGKQPLRLVQTIPLPNVKGRLDHMDVDVKGKRLFVAGLENGTFEVVDLQAGKWVHSIPGFKKGQGALFVPELNKLFLASGDDGMSVGGAGTSFWSPELNRYYVAAPATDKEAAILVCAPQD